MTKEPRTVNCDLCGKEHKEENYFVSYRTCWIETKASGWSMYQVLKGHGFYEPRLTQDEMMTLTSGQKNICIRRADCRERQRRAR